MAQTLKDAGLHTGEWGSGHYEVMVLDDGSVTILTKV